MSRCFASTSEVFGISDFEARAGRWPTPTSTRSRQTLYDALRRQVPPLETSDDEDVFLRAVVSYHLIAEGVIARTAQNLAAGQYAKYGSFPGLTTGQRLVARDEARHIGIGVSYCRQRMAEDSDARNDAITDVVEEFAESRRQAARDRRLAGGMDSQVSPATASTRGLLRRGDAALAAAPPLDRLPRRLLRVTCRS